MTEAELSIISTTVSALILAPSRYEDILRDCRPYVNSRDMDDALWALEMVFRDMDGEYDYDAVSLGLKEYETHGARMALRSLSFNHQRILASRVPAKAFQSLRH